ncbi:MAG: sugar transferase [Verrucomicrobiota bacterium]|jgi:exopolysaccharide biosynthesis polyprenyl glycosylphosphotransferase|nr:sugar transferase [Verrucomicrobiota bacterium]
MLRRSFKFQSKLTGILDAVLVSAALLAALVTHKILAELFPNTFAVFDMFWANAWLFIAVILVWGLTFDFCGVYNQFVGVSPKQAVTQVLRGGLLSLAILLGMLYVLRIHSIPRTLLGIHCFYAMAAVVLRILYIQPFLLRIEQKRHILLLGNAEQMQSIYPWLRQPTNQLFFDVIGALAAPGGHLPEGLFRLGAPEDFLQVLHAHTVDAVIILTRNISTDQAGEWLQQCETEGVEAWLIADYLRTAAADIALDEIAGKPMLLFSTTPRSAWSLALKQLADIVLSGLALVLLSPVFLVLAIIIRLTSPGPAFFLQRRCTLNGRTFLMYKFRTMVQNAEEIRKTLEAQNEVSGPVFKMKNDPRITPIGRWLRRYSLDELPQLWNVFKGDMSIVGPRPPIPSEVEKYESWQRRRLSMRSGCTCLWQVSGRNKLSFEDWMRLDLEYIDTWSLLLDFKIMLKTVGALFKGTGY